MIFIRVAYSLFATVMDLFVKHLQEEVKRK